MIALGSGADGHGEGDGAGGRGVDGRGVDGRGQDANGEDNGAETVPLLVGREPVAGAPAAYVCRNSPAGFRSPTRSRCRAS